ncbi:hypothetical protein FGW37_17705 [Streptomyces rectiverticillatus]|uniref:hypothetical protein n=1 Tax=Streptomyces rectiverticillatus TaxID=173860 RepID=UPI0015C3096B|nr:hypothetical protein [Streptomyces rectiverticillatus]QLE73177.1 hypothetical protein FGW37_17705 [Streptomyces rectiverticillatus]
MKRGLCVLPLRLITVAAVAGMAVAGASPVMADDHGGKPLVSTKNLMQGRTGTYLSPGSVQERKFVNDGTGAVLLDSANVRQGIASRIVSPHSVDRDVFVNRG